MTIDGSGNFWLTPARNEEEIVEISPRFHSKSFPLSSDANDGIIVGADGNIWFTKSFYVGKITSSGCILTRRLVGKSGGGSGQELNGRSGGGGTQSAGGMGGAGGGSSYVESRAIKISHVDGVESKGRRPRGLLMEPKNSIIADGSCDAPQPS